MSYLPHIKWLPIALCFTIPITFFITYGIALSNDHVEAFWPYISDTGTESPENCIFGELLNIAVAMLCTIVYVRYRHLQECINLKSTKIKPIWNKISFSFGLLSCFGLSLVANFQETHVLTVHLIGFFMCALFGTLYFIVQTVFTYMSKYGPKWLLWSRITISILVIVLTITTLAPMKASFDNHNGKRDMKKWKAKDGGYSYHLVSTISEWLLVFFYCAYIGTFHWEFRGLELKSVEIKIIDVEYEVTFQETQSEKSGTVNSSFKKSETNLSMSQWI